MCQQLRTQPDFFTPAMEILIVIAIEKSWNGKIHYHSIEEHPKISKIAKFGREML